MTSSKVGDRLAERPAPEIAQYLAGPRIENDRDNNFGYLSSVNKAHVYMLAQQGILESDVARTLLVTIKAMEDAGAENLPLDMEREDLFFNYEHELIERTNSH